MARIALYGDSIIMLETSKHLATDNTSHPSIIEAALDVVEAGQQVVVDRIELLRSDAVQTISRLQQQLFFWLAAAMLFATAWVVFNGTAIAFLAERFSWVIAGSIVGGANTIIGLALIAWNSRRETIEPDRTSQDGK